MKSILILNLLAVRQTSSQRPISFISTSSSVNFATLPKGSLLTATLPLQGFNLDASSHKLARLLKKFAAHMDLFTIMAFDFHAAAWSSTTGPNAPLAQCSPSSSSVAIAVQEWLTRGLPKEKVLLGLGTYSHLYKTKSGRLSESWFNDVKTKAFQELDTSEVTRDRNLNLDDMINLGILKPNGLAGSDGYKRFYDSCTSTPFLWSSTTRLFFAYEDAVSIKAKANFARKVGLLGLNFYDARGTNPSLIKAAREGLNAPEEIPIPGQMKNFANLKLGSVLNDGSIFDPVVNFPEEQFVFTEPPETRRETE